MDCGFKGKSLVLGEEKSAATLLVLLLLGFIPGLLYMLCVPSKRICPNCGSQRVRTMSDRLVGCLIWIILISAVGGLIYSGIFDDLSKTQKVSTESSGKVNYE